MSRVRVLHIITRLITGGADENTLLTVEGLDQARFDVTLAAGVPSEEEMISRVRSAEFVLVPNLQRELRPIKDLRAFIELARILKRGKYDLVHTHEAKAGILGRLAAKWVGTPIVVHTLHGITFHRHLTPPVRLLYLYLEKLAAKFTDAFLCVGEDLRRTYVTNRVGRPEQYRVVRSGFDVSRFERAAREREKFRRELRKRLNLPKNVTIVGTVARLEFRKGVQFLIDAASKLCPRWPHLHFAVAGMGDYRPSLEKLVAEHGLQDRFHFVGFVDRIEEYLAGLDLFALSSLWEGLPRALVQAGIVGLPVVTFDVEGAWEVVRDGETGYIVPSRDVDALAERLERLLRNPALAEKMGRKAQRGLAREWEIGKMIRDVEEVYAELLDGRTWQSCNES
ncbi:MAG: glycosyltransferase family 4 protein [Calditrichaeota bacterium]|nr:glycosyltransferase family 4 protein [Calditrichota bacterium]